MFIDFCCMSIFIFQLIIKYILKGNGCLLVCKKRNPATAYSLCISNVLIIGLSSVTANSHLQADSLFKVKAYYIPLARGHAARCCMFNKKRGAYMKAGAEQCEQREWWLLTQEQQREPDQASVVSGRGWLYSRLVLCRNQRRQMDSTHLQLVYIGSSVQRWEVYHQHWRRYANQLFFANPFKAPLAPQNNFMAGV